MNEQVWCEACQCCHVPHDPGCLFADLGPAPVVDDAPLVTRGFVLAGNGQWLRLDRIEQVCFNAGPGDDECLVGFMSGDRAIISGTDARAFWVAWTDWLKAE